MWRLCYKNSGIHSYESQYVHVDHDRVVYYLLCLGPNGAEALSDAFL